MMEDPLGHMATLFRYCKAGGFIFCNEASCALNKGKGKSACVTMRLALCVQNIGIVLGSIINTF